MTSQINPNNIDGTYPVAGQPNNTQGFRDNFTATKTNFSAAATEITDLQNNGIFKAALSGTTLDNNMSDNLIYAVKLNDVSFTALTQTATSGTITIDYSAAAWQTLAPAGNCSLAFTNWPASGSYGVVNLEMVITNTAYTLTLPTSVVNGLLGLAGYNSGTRTITFYQTGNFTYSFSSVDGGTTIQITDFDRPRNVFFSQVNVANTTTSTSTTTGALVVAGGIGVGANINIGGNLKTFTTANAVAFSALDTGFVTLNAPTVAANTAGALNIVGSTTGAYQPIYSAGGMVHITGNDGQSSRMSNDSFGTGASSVFVQRSARGTAAAPTAVQSGDILARITGTGYGTTGYPLAAGNIGTLGIDFVALENYTDSAAGSAMKFYTSPVGVLTKTLSANVTANVTTFPANVSVTGNIAVGNISLTGNVTSALNVTGNIVAGNISSIANLSAGNITTSTGNIITSAGNVLVSGGTGGVGYTTGAGGTATQSGGGGKSASVTLNKATGEITMANNNLAAATIVSFTFNNTTIGANDLLLLQHQSGGTLGSYTLNAACAANVATVYVRNNTAGGLAEALVLRYAVIKGATA